MCISICIHIYIFIEREGEIGEENGCLDAEAEAGAEAGC